MFLSSNVVVCRYSTTSGYILWSISHLRCERIPRVYMSIRASITIGCKVVSECAFLELDTKTMFAFKEEKNHELNSLSSLPVFTYDRRLSDCLTRRLRL